MQTKSNIPPEDYYKLLISIADGIIQTSASESTFPEQFLIYQGQVARSL